MVEIVVFGVVVVCTVGTLLGGEDMIGFAVYTVGALVVNLDLHKY